MGRSPPPVLDDGQKLLALHFLHRHLRISYFDKGKLDKVLPELWNELTNATRYNGKQQDLKTSFKRLSNQIKVCKRMPTFITGRESIDRFNFIKAWLKKNEEQEGSMPNPEATTTPVAPQEARKDPVVVKNEPPDTGYEVGASEAPEGAAGEEIERNSQNEADEAEEGLGYDSDQEEPFHIYSDNQEDYEPEDSGDQHETASEAKEGEEAASGDQLGASGTQKEQPLIPGGSASREMERPFTQTGNTPVPVTTPRDTTPPARHGRTSLHHVQFLDQGTDEEASTPRASRRKSAKPKRNLQAAAEEKKTPKKRGRLAKEKAMDKPSPGGLRRLFVATNSSWDDFCKNEIEAGRIPSLPDFRNISGQANAPEINTVATGDSILNLTPASTPLQNSVNEQETTPRRRSSRGRTTANEKPDQQQLPVPVTPPPSTFPRERFEHLKRQLAATVSTERQSRGRGQVNKTIGDPMPIPKPQKTPKVIRGASTLSQNPSSVPTVKTPNSANSLETTPRARLPSVGSVVEQRILPPKFWRFGQDVTGTSLSPESRILPHWMDGKSPIQALIKGPQPNSTKRARTPGTRGGKETQRKRGRSTGGAQAVGQRTPFGRRGNATVSTTRRARTPVTKGGEETQRKRGRTAGGAQCVGQMTPVSRRGNATIRPTASSLQKTTPVGPARTGRAGFRNGKLVDIDPYGAPIIAPVMTRGRARTAETKKNNGTPAKKRGLTAKAATSVPSKGPITRSARSTITLGRTTQTAPGEQRTPQSRGRPPKVDVGKKRSRSVAHPSQDPSTDSPDVFSHFKSPDVKSILNFFSLSMQQQELASVSNHLKLFLEQKNDSTPTKRRRLG